jgi:hypothetical protein
MCICIATFSAVQDGELGQSIEEQAVPLIGNRRFWVYRADPAPWDAGGEEAFNDKFGELEAAFQTDRSGPVGICVPVGDPEAIRAHPEALWETTNLLYAGTAPDGAQLRIRYFREAAIAPGMPGSPIQSEWERQDHSLAAGYRIVPLADTDTVSTGDVLEMWTREDAMPAAEAQRRVHEVLMVALDPSDRVAGVSTVYLAHNPQLGMDLWYYRTYVVVDHRMENLSLNLLWATRDHLRDRYLSGEETRAPGVLMEVENPFLQNYYNTGYWVISDFSFIGDSELGGHVRVHYFPGARVPTRS